MSENSTLRIHTQIRPEERKGASAPVCQRKRRRVRERAPLTHSDRLLRNSAIACALLLGILTLGNLRQPWAEKAARGIERALTMHINLDDSIGELTFVRQIMPESALVFLNVSGGAGMTRPCDGAVVHPWSAMQPWLVFEDGVRPVLLQNLQHRVDISAGLIEEEEGHDRGNAVLLSALFLFIRRRVGGHPGGNRDELRPCGLHNPAEILRGEVGHADAPFHQLRDKGEGGIDVSEGAERNNCNMHQNTPFCQQAGVACCSISMESSAVFPLSEQSVRRIGPGPAFFRISWARPFQVLQRPSL